MRALATCIGKAGKSISAIEAKMLRASADKYRAEGFSAHESNVGAVSEAIAELEEDLQSITAQVKAYPIVEQGLPDTEGAKTVVAVDQSVIDQQAQASEAMLAIFAQIEKSCSSLLGEKVYSSPKETVAKAGNQPSDYLQSFSKIEESLKRMSINNPNTSVSSFTSTPISTK